VDISFDLQTQGEWSWAQISEPPHCLAFTDTPATSASVSIVTGSEIHAIAQSN
jgi:hypothetical protein